MEREGGGLLAFLPLLRQPFVNVFSAVAFDDYSVLNHATLYDLMGWLIIYG